MEGVKLTHLADLHVHLGATTRPHFLWELAHMQGMRLPEKNYWKFIELIKISKKIGSKDYLKKVGNVKQESPFVLSHRIQSSPYAVEECVHAAVAGAYRKSNIDLIELRFNPIFRSHNSEYDLDKIILSAVTGLRRAMIEYPVQAGIIIESDRQFDKKKHLILANKAVKFRNLGVVGFDISGPTTDRFQIKDLIEPVKIIKNAGLGFTIHTGEFTDVDEMWEIVEKLSPDRIGHGIKAAKDKKLMSELVNKKIILELCPTSNVMTSVVSGWQEMVKIIKTFKDNGVKFTINSDGPEFLGTNVKEEFLKLLKLKVLNWRDVKNITNLAHRATFINYENR